jgi:tRNA G18 (ribose-2'-O)-methylase SpoU/L-amino acid N-acyltransferase YncA
VTDADSIIVRAARPGDLAEIVRLCAAHAVYERSEYDPAGAAERLAALLFGPAPRLHCLIATRDDRPVGYASWSIEVATWEATVHAHMDGLYLDEAARGRGIGRRLMARLARDARAAGCRQLQWQTPSFNVRAMPFYDRLGPTRLDKVRYTLDGPALDELADEAGVDADADAAIVAHAGPPAAPAATASFATVLHQLTSPANVGMIVRTHVAMGGGDVVFVGLDRPWQFRKNTQAFSRRLERLCRITYLDDDAAFFDWCARTDHTPVAVEILATAVPLPAIRFPARPAIVVGHEGRGLPASFTDRCPLTTVIPQFGPVACLNVAASASIAMYELVRSRETARDIRGNKFWVEPVDRPPPP